MLALPGGEGIEAEEAFVTLTSIPRVNVNIGKFKQPFGRENLLHTHALPTVDKSLVGERVFGEEGLNDMGVDAAILLPATWFSEVTVGVDAGSNEVLYGSGEPLGLGSFAHWTNLFDFGSSSLQLGLSGLTGLAPGDERTFGEGVDVTFKTRGSGRHQFRRLTWQSELILAQPGGGDELAGVYSVLQASPTRGSGSAAATTGSTPTAASPRRAPPSSAWSLPGFLLSASRDSGASSPADTLSTRWWPS